MGPVRLARDAIGVGNRPKSTLSRLIRSCCPCEDGWDERGYWCDGSPLVVVITNGGTRWSRVG